MTDAVIDVDSLLAPIPGENPAGATVPHPTRQQLRAARKETEPHPDDPSQPDIPRKVDWRGLIRECEQILTKTSKDLEVALQMTEALTKVHDFAGARDGFKLLSGLVEQCWDRLHPIPDPEDGEGMEVRSERFQWIAETDYGALYPQTIRRVPIVNIGGTPHSMFDRKLALEGRGEVSGEAFESSTPLTENTAEDLDACLKELSKLEVALDEKLGQESPSLTGLRAAVEEAHNFMTLLMRKRQAEKSAEEADAADSAAADSTPAAATAGPAASTGSLRSREDAYRQIGKIADFLEKLEPHSPIPDLLRRAVELGKLPFRKLVTELVRDGNLLSEIRREFGIHDGEESS